MKFIRGNVLRNKETEKKSVCFKEFDDEKNEFELVCERAHDDGDYSYICTNHNWCRCCQ